MPFRVIMLENDMNVRYRLNSLVVEKEDSEIVIPIVDISMLVIDNLTITLTSRLMSILAENNVGIIFCNKEHLPIGFYSSYDNHSRVAKKIKYQIDQKGDFYDDLWSEIVRKKLTNQAYVLELLKQDTESIRRIYEYIDEVQTGDTTNREAHGAKVYFNSLMGTSFSRGNQDILLNSGLDYGYTIIRSYLARTCVGYGLNSQLGIHHRNEFNRFNLIDDLIEPIRPFVDLFAYELLKNEKYFTPESRKELINLLNHRVKYKGKKMYLCNMIEEYVAAFASALEQGNTDGIVYPDLKGYEMERLYGV